jgi:hypothetical protein
MLRQLAYSVCPAMQQAAAAASFQYSHMIQRTWQHGTCAAASSSLHTTASCSHGHSSDDENAET